MAELDPTARESNFRDSVKKFFVDNLYKTEGVELSFDKTLSTPKVQGVEIEKWYMILFGSFNPNVFGDAEITIFCCAKKDSEGFKVAQLRDKVMKYLVDTDQTDCAKRVVLYRSSATEVWTSIGTMIIEISDNAESSQMEAEDGTKFKTISVRFRWSAKL